MQATCCFFCTFSLQGLAISHVEVGETFLNILGSKSLALMSQKEEVDQCMGPIVGVTVGSEPCCYPMKRGKMMKKKVGGEQLLPSSAQFVSIFVVEFVGWLHR